MELKEKLKKEVKRYQGKNIYTRKNKIQMVENKLNKLKWHSHIKPNHPIC